MARAAASLRKRAMNSSDSRANAGKGRRCPASRWGYSRVHLRMNQATGLMSTAVTSQPCALAILATTVTLFVTLYPNVMPSTTAAANSLTIHNASSSHYTLQIMTVVAVIFTPLVLLYQGWTYWVFRKRIGVDDIPLDAAAAGGPAGHPAGSPVGGAA